jgi:hypothetical protein
MTLSEITYQGYIKIKSFIYIYLDAITTRQLRLYYLRYITCDKAQNQAPKYKIIFYFLKVELDIEVEHETRIQKTQGDFAITTQTI